MLDSLRSRLILLLLGMLAFMTVAMGFAALGAMQRDSAAQARQALEPQKASKPQPLAQAQRPRPRP